MRRLTLKFLGIIIITMFISSLIPNMLWTMFAQGDNITEIGPRGLLFGGFITVFLTLSLFSFFIDRIFIRRLSRLNSATRDVMKGDYSNKLEVIQNDELSDLILNFNRMTKTLQSNEYLNKEFVRNFSHELKTPLSAIKGYADLIKQEDLTIEEQKEYAYIISAEAERLSSLSKNMLQISLVDSQNIIKKLDVYNITEQVRNVIQLMQLDWEKKHIVLNLELEEVTITSNKEFTYQIWTNLISNAIKFSQDGNRLNISVLEKNETVQFDITNSGSILTDDQDKVYDLFFVAEQSRSNQSNGVGLTLTRKIVQKLDGTISFVSKDNQVTFTVILPI